jgi:YbgC/YbaW family acyl-CoA thioester hydrolase
MYSKTQLIHFNQCDPAGILYFAESLVIAHQTIEAFMMQEGPGWQNWFQHSDIAFPLKHVECDYFAPLFVGAQCQIKLSVSRLSSSTVTFSSVACDDKQKFFEVTTVHTAMNKKTFRKDQIPNDFHKLFSAHLAEDTAVNT